MKRNKISQETNRLFDELFNDNYYEDITSIIQFIIDECLVNEDYIEAAALVYRAYEIWCKRQSLNIHDKKKFKELILSITTFDVDKNIKQLFDCKRTRVEKYDGLKLIKK